MTNDDFMFMLEGFLGQLEMGKAYYEQKGMPTLPLDTLTASMTTSYLLVKGEAESEQLDKPVDEGECKHPEEKVQKQVVGGGHYLLLCTACQTIIEQG